MECLKFVILISICLPTAFAAPPSVTGHYRTDYFYNRKSNAFYKLHVELRLRWQLSRACTIEGAFPMAITSDQDLVQVHAMMKKYPDVGEYVWVADDGLTHESAEEQPIIDLDTSSTEIKDSRDCEVITRDGAVKSSFCYQTLPFVCKVDAKDAPYDEHCGVYARDYHYYASVGSCYKIPRVTYKWNQAYAECQAEGAHLVVINSETEREVVQNFVNTERGVVGAFTNWFFLAGFRAKKTTGDTPRVFKTIMNQTLEEAGFAEWAAHEPNNVGGNEYCGSVFKHNGKLNDVDCNNFYAFICEKEVRQT